MVEENLPKPDEERKLRVSTVRVSKREMQEHASDEDKVGKDWAYGRIIEQMPEGELKEALLLARDDRNARLQRLRTDHNYVYSNPNPLVEGSDIYAFRAIKRTNGGIDSVLEVTKVKGIEATDLSLKYISGCWPIDDFLFPNSKKDPSEDLHSILFVYKNGPFRHPDDEPGNGKIYVHNPREISRTEMDMAEADEKNIPTLKENLLGIVQVDWED